ncbi:hypothetical protein [Clostridium sp.]|uniref:hypothetical protein n=1 Tax=Clostridium sp. TaxID=1506 RepID=UPI002FC96D08
MASLEKVSIKVFKEIPLDEDLNPIKDIKVFNSVYLSCDDLEVFLGTIETKEELLEFVEPSGLIDIFENYLNPNEVEIFNKALEHTKRIYSFNDKEYKLPNF